ncbi:HAD-IA family hydrolase [Paraburkholderia oxyphila]|uniref:HAD-IA family hydrolase n=1 Tax=Paraburkholderia oxyphila TaxID=614212 RepID=UPI00142891CE|nr:HAD-IA family hydrolase [Paraburkholderia oxyphila]
MIKGNSLGIEALALDTGGTIFNWHDRFVRAFEEWVEPVDAVLWRDVVNDWRQRSLKTVLGKERAEDSMDMVHQRTLEETLAKFGLSHVDAARRTKILDAWYDLEAWDDFPASIRSIREKYPVVSLTVLPVALVMENSRRNDLVWDAIISCEMTGVYKPHPQAYLRAAAWLKLKPSAILMVACHNVDLNAAKNLGMRTAFVHRPEEWGPVHRPDAGPNMDYDFVVESFDDLAYELLSDRQ